MTQGDHGQPSRQVVLPRGARHQRRDAREGRGRSWSGPFQALFIDEYPTITAPLYSYVFI